MNPFVYRNGVLHAEHVPLDRLADLAGTPAYVYSATAMTDAYTAFASAFADIDATICYALKANSNLAVIRTFAKLGAGADVVSEGELARALAAGVPPARIVFAGVGKTRQEMEAGLRAGIHQFNVESEPELLALDAVARSLGKRAPVAIRVNPDVDAGTHAKITTGRKGNKFGIDFERAGAAYALATRLPGLEPVGVALHLGSQLTDFAPLRTAFTRVAGLVRDLRAAGIKLQRMDFGGGIGIPYRGESVIDIAAYAALVKEIARDLGCQAVLEPGRLLVGNAGILLSRVVFVKPGARRIVILDAGMNDLLRPALYDAHHAILPIRQAAHDAEVAPADIAGPVCESSDVFARDRPMPPLAEGDLVAISSSGAYSAAMASNYNSRPLPPEILIRGEAVALVRRRQTVADLFANESLPDWLADPTQARDER